MAVLVEGISVVVRRDSIERKVLGGWEHFCFMVHNATLCFDEDLARVGFLSPQAVREFIRELESVGLTFIEDDQPVDLVVLDQQTGPTAPCDWIEFTRMRWPGDSEEDNRVGACWLWDKPRIGSGIHLPALGISLATPVGWQFEGSLSHKFTFTEDSD
jgi:hypothetical protein